MGAVNAYAVDHRMVESCGIWLEVSKVRHQATLGVFVQVEGDREDREPQWWKVCVGEGEDESKGKSEDESKDKSKAEANHYRDIAKALDRNQAMVLAYLGISDGVLRVIDYRIQHNNGH